MATSLKITQMDKATILAGGEMIPIVQNGANKSSTVDLLRKDLATQAWVHDAIENAGTKTVVVPTLPIEGDGNKIYLVPNNSSSANDIYDEYIWLGPVDKWEFLGNKQVTVDLTPYYTKVETDDKFVKQVTGKQLSANDFTTPLKTRVDNLSTYVTIADLRITEDGLEYSKSTKDPNTGSITNATVVKVPLASSEQFGLMSLADKIKLNDLSVIAVDDALSPTSINPVQNNVINTALSSLVTLSTAQTITGAKTFSTTIAFTNGDVNVKGNGTWLKLSNNTTPRIQIGDLNMLPCADNATDIGGSAFRWRNVYSMNGMFYGKLGMVGGSDMYPHIYGNGSFLLLSGANDNNKSIVIDANNKMYPMLDGTIDCGTNNNRWATLYSNKGNFSNQITSTVATGTAPFIVSSNTTCMNLNAHYVGGRDSNNLTHYQQMSEDANNVSTTTSLLLSTVNTATAPTIIGGNSWLMLKQINGSSAVTYDSELAFGFDSDYLAIRRKKNSSTWGAWNKVSAGLSDVATKLQIQRAIWGQGFDGTSDVNGHLWLGVNYLYGHDNKAMIYSNPSGHTVVSACGGNLYLDSGGTNAVVLRSGGATVVERTAIEANGDLRHFGKMIVGGIQSPLITLALGDSDTGFNWTSDGNFSIMANGSQIARFDAFAMRFSKLLTSEVTGGTAPISVVSTTVCPNLNADLLDGKHSNQIGFNMVKIWGSTSPMRSGSGILSETPLRGTLYLIETVNNTYSVSTIMGRMPSTEDNGYITGAYTFANKLCYMLQAELRVGNTTVTFNGDNSGAIGGAVAIYRIIE